MYIRMFNKFRFYIYININFVTFLLYLFYIVFIFVIYNVFINNYFYTVNGEEMIIRTNLRSPKLNYGRPYVQTTLDGFQLIDIWSRLQDERRTIFDDYEPDYMKRTGLSDPSSSSISQKWIKVAQSTGRLKQIDADTFAFTYNRDILFDNTVWKPGMRWRPIYIPESVRLYAEPILSYTNGVIVKTKDLVSPYINVWTVTGSAIIFFVGGTTYIGYLAEQGAFDWLDASQAEVNLQLRERYKFFFDLWDSWSNGGENVE